MSLPRDASSEIRTDESSGFCLPVEGTGLRAERPDVCWDTLQGR
jgi:hypothetical protein